MKRIITTGIFAYSCLSFIACEKEVKFDLPADVSDKLVVEGSIETGLPPFVTLTKTFGFFSNLDFNSLKDAFISGAKITVSDGSRTIVLREYSVDTAGSTFKFYTVDSARLEDLSFVGQVGKTYELKIEVNGKTYEAASTIQQPAVFDSIWSAPWDNPTEEQLDFRKVVVKYTDPAAPGDRFRVVIKQNDRPFLPERFSTSNDDIINGTTTELEFNNVVSPMDTTTDQRNFAFYVGDTVTIKFMAIDKGTYTFWSTLDFSVGTTGNPFASPIAVISNISNGALGVWGAYSPTYMSIRIKE
jgi:hypothetical protein